MLFQSAAGSVLCLRVAGHGVMYEPPTRNGQGWSILSPGCAGGSCLWFNQGAGIGCPKCTGGASGKHEDQGVCNNPDEPTIQFRDGHLGTYNLHFHLFQPVSWMDWSRTHPWRKPGSAPVEDSCGIAGGWYADGNPLNGARPPYGHAVGTRGSTLPKLLKETIWEAGSTVEVAWGIFANHGGGYQYRLCPAGSDLTEDCFQKLPLEFVGNQSWLQFGGGFNRSTRKAIPAIDVSEGTLPLGSTWRKNPVPACGDSFHGGACKDRFFNRLKCHRPQFPEPFEGVSGFGGARCALEQRDLDAHPNCGCTDAQFEEENHDFGIVDKVKVPMLPGDYVLSWRWDCEQTPQVWTACGDVKIVEAGAAQSTTAFEIYDGCESCCPELNGICSNCTKCTEDKTGDCEYCWTPLKGFAPKHVPVAQCLGFETKLGTAPHWSPGQKAGGWSPGCSKCWADGACSNISIPRVAQHRTMEQPVTV